MSLRVFCWDNCYPYSFVLPVVYFVEHTFVVYPYTVASPHEYGLKATHWSRSLLWQGQFALGWLVGDAPGNCHTSLDRFANKYIEVHRWLVRRIRSVGVNDAVIVSTVCACSDDHEVPTAEYDRNDGSSFLGGVLGLWTGIPQSIT